MEKPYGIIELHIFVNAIWYDLQRIISGLFDTKGPPQGQVSDDIKGESVNAFGHIHGRRPVITVSEELIPTVDMFHDESRCCTHRFLRKGLTQEAALTRMHGGVDTVKY